MTSFNEWLASGTIKRREVNMYADAATMDEMAALAERAAKVAEDEKRDRANGDWAASRKSELPAIEAQAETLMAKYEASKSVWHVRANTPAEKDAALAQVPMPEAPVEPRPDASEEAHAEYVRAVRAFRKAATEAEFERRLILLSKAVEKIESPMGTIPGVTVDDLRAMVGAAYGPERITMLWAAVTEAGQMGEAPIPFSLRASETTPD